MRGTTLYRYFDSDGQLLYIGISDRLGTRLEQHRHNSLWFEQAATLKFEQFVSRTEALRAEAAAIKAERPLYNVMHAQSGSSVAAAGKQAPKSKELLHAGEHRVVYKRSGNVVWASLYLYPELDGSAGVDERPRGADPFDYYVSYVKRHHPEWLKRNAVPILWSVEDEHHGIGENAPFQPHYKRLIPDLWADFLTFCEWPTDRDGNRIDFYKLPVLIDKRFPAFAKSLDWIPSPLQPTAPLKTILASRTGVPA